MNSQLVYCKLMSRRESELYIGLSPCPVTVTTRIIIFLVGDPNLNLHLLLLLGGGTTQLYNWPPKYVVSDFFDLWVGPCSAKRRSIFDLAKKPPFFVALQL